MFCHQQRSCDFCMPFSKAKSKLICFTFRLLPTCFSDPNIRCFQWNTMYWTKCILISKNQRCAVGYWSHKLLNISQVPRLKNNQTMIKKYMICFPYPNIKWHTCEEYRKFRIDSSISDIHATLEIKFSQLHPIIYLDGRSKEYIDWKRIHQFKWNLVKEMP